ncbi:Phosphoribulokinase [Dactylellina cionopaga]|nr:Phosphoribulokinase [Dactylellina cionopaga]
MHPGTALCVAPTFLQQQDAAFAGQRLPPHAQTFVNLKSIRRLVRQSSLSGITTTTAAMPPMRSNSCIVVSISGGQAAGKKSVQAAIATRLKELSGGRLRITCLHMGDFMKRLDDEGRADASAGVRDMDCIDAYDLDSLVTTMRKIRDNEPNITIPKYDILKFQHEEEETPLDPTNGLGETGPTDVLLVEGCYMLCEKRLVEMADIKVFVDLNADARLGRRVVRDTEERGFPLDKVFDQYLRFGKRAFEGRIEPTKSRADVILPKGVEGAAVDLIALGIWDDINTRADQANNLTSEYERKGSIVGKSLGGSHTISIGEVDLERFYDPI